MALERLVGRQVLISAMLLVARPEVWQEAGTSAVTVRGAEGTGQTFLQIEEVP